MMTIKVHFDGKVLVPDEPLEVPTDTPLIVEIREAPPSPLSGERIPGLQRGSVIWMADDFDAPMPDEFWLGEE